MATINVSGANPLVGDVYISGSKNVALKVIHAAMYSNEAVIINNIPKINDIIEDLQIIQELGGQCEWLGESKLLLNGSTINSFRIPFELGSKSRTSLLLAAPLVFRFGKAIMPKPKNCKIGMRPINRFIDAWKGIGFEVFQDEDFIYIQGDKVESCDFSFKKPTRMGTEVAILSSLFCDGEVSLNGCSEDTEIENLVEFVNLMGANVTITDTSKIMVKGTRVFKGVEYTLPSDALETVTFAVAALSTKGNINIKNVNKKSILSFINVLNKIEASYELIGEDLRIWRSEEQLLPIDIQTAPAPGFSTDWHPLMSLLLTQSAGVSHIYETVYLDNFDYISDLNSLGGDLKLIRPSQIGKEFITNSDDYDFKTLGEAKTVVKIEGNSKLQGTKLTISNLKYGALPVLIGLTAHGDSSIAGYENIERGFYNFANKLHSLGAKIEVF